MLSSIICHHSKDSKELFSAPIFNAESYQFVHDNIYCEEMVQLPENLDSYMKALKQEEIDNENLKFFSVSREEMEEYLEKNGVRLSVKGIGNLVIQKRLASEE